jgi:hypothetical protein
VKIVETREELEGPFSQILNAVYAQIPNIHTGKYGNIDGSVL